VPARARDQDDPGFRAIELAQRGRMILDVAAADLAAAEAMLGSFHETTWYFRQALADARRAWDRLRVFYGLRALEKALTEPPATILTLGEKADGSDPAAILLVITGRTYRVRRLRGTAMAPVLWRLDRFPPADPSELEADPFALDPYHLARLAGGRPVCDCGEWFFRVAEAEHPTGLCKHLAALRSLGWV
jgi:hypothetical protein